MKTIQELNLIVNNYYSFIPKSQSTTIVFNVPRRAGRKPRQQKLEKENNNLHFYRRRQKTGLFHLNKFFHMFHLIERVSVVCIQCF